MGHGRLSAFAVLGIEGPPNDHLMSQAALDSCTRDRYDVPGALGKLRDLSARGCAKFEIAARVF
jgi:hypothetical protein